MEVMWRLEDTWKLTTQKALLLFACSAFAVLGVCILTVLRRRNSKGQHRKEMVNQEQHQARGGGGGGACSSWLSLTKWRMLMESLRWSSKNKIFPPPPPPPQSQSQSQPPLLGSLSPVWQRPILMGEKCELPRFSGLILYDDKGILLHNQTIDQGKPTTVMRTTLRDLL